MARDVMRTKFNVDKRPKDRTFDGIEFDSAMEMKYYRDIILPQVRSGQIQTFERQKRYELQPEFIHDGIKVRPIYYICDFFIQYTDGREEVIDIKGFADQKAIIKRKLFWYHFPDFNYHWLTYSKVDGGWVEHEIVKKNRKIRAEQRKRRKSMKEEEEKLNGEEN